MPYPRPVYATVEVRRFGVLKNRPAEIELNSESGVDSIQEGIRIKGYLGDDDLFNRYDVILGFGPIGVCLSKTEEKKIGEICEESYRKHQIIGISLANTRIILNEKVG